MSVALQILLQVAAVLGIAGFFGVLAWVIGRHEPVSYRPLDVRTYECGCGAKTTGCGRGGADLDLSVEKCGWRRIHSIWECPVCLGIARPRAKRRDA